MSLPRVRLYDTIYIFDLISKIKNYTRSILYYTVMSVRLFKYSKASEAYMVLLIFAMSILEKL